MKNKPLRTVASSLNLLTTLVLLSVLFIFINYISSRRYTRIDFTQNKLTAISDQTRQVLQGLTEPIQVTVFYQPNHRLYEMVKDLLEEYQRYAPNLKVEFIDPEQDVARAKQLAQAFAIEALNVVVFTSGDNHKHVSDMDLAELDYTAMQRGAEEPRVVAFKGEEAFTSALISVTQKSQPLVWFTGGHGEKPVDAEDPNGLSKFKEALEQRNMKSEAVTLLERSAIPENVTLIIIAGPTRRFTDSEVTLLKGYLERGGRLLALIDPLTDTGLDGLLQEWGVRLGNDIVVDPSRQLPFVSAANLFVTTYTEHPIVGKMQTLMTLYPLARSVQPLPGAPEELDVQPLALTSDKGWGETTTDVETFEKQPGDVPGPVSIAVAVEKKQPVEVGAASKPPTRVVVFGDSEFAINSQLDNVGNKDVALGSVFWLTEQEKLIAIGPKTLESIKLNLTGQQLRNLFWLSVLMMPMFCGVAGAATWWRRRT